MSAENGPKRRRGVLVDADRLHQERRSREWTIKEVAQKVKEAAQKAKEKVPCGVKAVGKVEKKGERCERKLIKALADLYNIPYMDLILPETEEDGEELLERATKEYDERAMDFGRAIKGAGAVIDALDEQSPVRARACVALASFWDHVGNPQRGIEILEKYFFGSDKNSAPKAIQDQWPWALYTRGFLRRRYAESLLARSGWKKSPRVTELLDLARKDLEESQKMSGKKDVAGIQHHLGVIEMLEERYEKALELFRRSIVLHEERWEKRKKKKGRAESEPLPSKRLGYSYRRLALCCLFLGFDKHAVEHFREAIRIASELGHERLLTEILADLDAWGISLA